MQRKAIEAAVFDPATKTEVAQQGEGQEKRDDSKDRAERGSASPRRQPAGPRAGQQDRDLQLTVRYRSVLEELSRRARWHDPPCRFMKPNQQEQWQQPDAGQKEGHG